MWFKKRHLIVLIGILAATFYFFSRKPTSFEVQQRGGGVWDQFLKSLPVCEAGCTVHPNHIEIDTTSSNSGTGTSQIR